MNHAMVSGLLLGTALGLAIWAVWRDRLPRARVWLLFFAGLVSAGLLGHLAARVATALVTASTSVTGKLFGVGTGVLLAVIAAAELWTAAHPRHGHGGHRFAHTTLAFLAPSLFLAAGGLFTASLGLGTSVINNIASAISGLL